ncbi:MAG: hypothetical protein Q9218_004983 [Villophora microphyllina]
MFSHRDAIRILDRSLHLQNASTHLDFLQVSEDDVLWEQGLDDNSIRPHIKVSPHVEDCPRHDQELITPGIESTAGRQTARFTKTVPNTGYTTERLHVRLETLNSLCHCFEISPLFLAGVLNPSPWAKLGHGSFFHPRAGEKSNTVECFYQYLNGWNRGPSYVWFSHEPTSSTYLLLDCPENAKINIVRQAQEDPVSFLACPFIIDAFIAGECANSWLDYIDEPRHRLLHWENNGGQGIPLQSIIHTPNGTEVLHGLSRTFQSIAGDLTDFDERLTFLIELGKRCWSMDAPPSSISLSAVETLIYLRSRNCIWKRWVEHYNERARLMINLFFNIGTQVDSRTNLEIANLTSKIAVDAQRDSSSMITIAAVTMVFLPGTFISVR